MTEQSRLSNFQERYQSGTIPWDDELPPPEVEQLAKELEPGRALDLGCGYGRSSIYLASLGWHVVGVDFVPEAIVEANRRAQKAGLSTKVQFHQADVTDLAFLESTFDLIVDIGCMHSFAGEELAKYRDGVLRLLGEGGRFLLFAHLFDPSAEDSEEIRWIEEQAIREAYLLDLALDQVTYGVTQVQDKPAWKSAWFLFKK